MSDEQKKPIKCQLSYSRGYTAGRASKKEASTDAKLKTEITALKAELIRLQKIRGEQRERVFLRCLEMALRDCSGWRVGGEEIKDAKGYCRLAGIFANEAISNINE